MPLLTPSLCEEIMFEPWVSAQLVTSIRAAGVDHAWEDMRNNRRTFGKGRRRGDGAPPTRLPRNHPDNAMDNRAFFEFRSERFLSAGRHTREYG